MVAVLATRDREYFLKHDRGALRPRTFGSSLVFMSGALSHRGVVEFVRGRAELPLNPIYQSTALECTSYARPQLCVVKGNATFVDSPAHGAGAQWRSRPRTASVARTGWMATPSSMCVHDGSFSSPYTLPRARLPAAPTPRSPRDHGVDVSPTPAVAVPRLELDGTFEAHGHASCRPERSTSVPRIWPRSRRVRTVPRECSKRLPPALSLIHI